MTTITTQRCESILSPEDRSELIGHLNGADQEDIRTISQKVTKMITASRALRAPDTLDDAYNNAYMPEYILNENSMRRYTRLLIDDCQHSSCEKVCLITAEIARMVKELNRCSYPGLNDYLNNDCTETTFHHLSSRYFSMRLEATMRSEFPGAEILEKIIGKEMLAFTSELQPPLQEKMWTSYTSRVLQDQISIYVTKNDIDQFLEITSLLHPPFTFEHSWRIKKYEKLIEQNNPEQIKKILGSKPQAFTEAFCTCLAKEGRHDLVQKIIDSIDDLPKKILLLQYIAAERLAPCQEMLEKIGELRRQMVTIGRELSDLLKKAQHWDEMIRGLMGCIKKIQVENAFTKSDMAKIEELTSPPGDKKVSSMEESDLSRMKETIRTSLEKDDLNGIARTLKEVVDVYGNRLAYAEHNIGRLRGEKYRASERLEITQEERDKRLNLLNDWLIQGLRCATELTDESQKLKIFQQINKTSSSIACDPRLDALVNSLCEKNQFMDALILKILQDRGGWRDIYEKALQEKMSWGDDPSRRDQCLLEFITRIIPQLDADVIYDIDPTELASCIHDVKMKHAAVLAIRERNEIHHDDCSVM